MDIKAAVGKAAIQQDKRKWVDSAKQLLEGKYWTKIWEKIQTADPPLGDPGDPPLGDPRDPLGKSIIESDKAN